MSKPLHNIIFLSPDHAVHGWVAFVLSVRMSLRVHECSTPEQVAALILQNRADKTKYIQLIVAAPGREQYKHWLRDAMAVIDRETGCVMPVIAWDPQGRWEMFSRRASIDRTMGSTAYLQSLVRLRLLTWVASHGYVKHTGEA